MNQKNKAYNFPRGNGFGRMSIVNGGLFDLVNPDPKMVELPHIARALSNQARFNGQTYAPYSVAQHSVLCYEYGKRMGWATEILQWMLMHDAAEAYIGDVIRPIKRNLQPFKRLERNVMTAIVTRFGLHTPIPVPEIKSTDTLIMYLEMKHFYADADWSQPELYSIQDAVRLCKFEESDGPDGCWDHEHACSQFTLAAEEVGIE